MAASVKQLDNGEFAVVFDGEIVAGPFETNAAAWRAADRYSGEAINRSENTAEWVFKKMGDPA